MPRSPAVTGLRLTAAPVPRMGQQATIGRRLAGGTAWVFGGRIGSRAITLLVNVAVAKLLVPASVGTLLLTITLVTIGATIARWGMESTAIRLIAQNVAAGAPAGARASVRLTITGTLLGSGIVAGALGTGGWKWLSLHVFHSTQMVGLGTSAALLLVALAAQQTVSSWFKGLHEMRFVAIFDELLANVLWCAGLFALWLASGKTGVAALIWLRALAMGVTLATMLVLFRGPYRRLRGSQGQAPPLREVLDLGTTLMFTSLVALVIGTTSDMAILASYRSKAEVAGYGIAASLAGLVAIPMLSSNPTVAASFAGIRGEPDERRRLEQAVRKITAALSLPGIVLVVLFAVAGGPLLSFAFGPSYAHSARVLVVLSLAQLIYVLTGPFDLALQMMGRQRVAFSIALVTAATSMGADVFAASRWGAVGVAVATGLVMVLNNLFTMVLAKRLTGILTLASFRPRDLGDLANGLYGRVRALRA